MLNSLFSRINIGEPASAGPLRVFPVFPLCPPTALVALISDAVAKGLASIEEVDGGTGAWFRRLGIFNGGRLPLLVRDSDLLKGGRQDRTIEQTCLLPTGQRTVVPTLCVEQSRSHYSGAHDFTVSRSSVDANLRSARMRSASAGRDMQGETWDQVASLRAVSGLRQSGGSLIEVEQLNEERLAALEAALPPVYQATGLVIASARHGAKPALVAEFFSDAPTCAAAWPGLVRAAALRSGVTEKAPRVSRTEVRSFLQAAARAEATTAPVVGLGHLSRLSFGQATGSVLTLDGQVVHAALLAA